MSQLVWPYDMDDIILKDGSRTSLKPLQQLFGNGAPMDVGEDELGNFVTLTVFKQYSLPNTNPNSKNNADPNP